MKEGIILLSLLLVGLAGCFDPISVKKCEVDLLAMLNTNNVLSLQMLDYTGKAVGDLGNYDGCIRLDQSKAHYCLAQFMVRIKLANEILPEYVGLCVPASCDPISLTFLFKVFLTDPKYNLTEKYGLQEELDTFNVHCTSGHESELTDGAVVTIIIVIILGLLVLVGTYLEYADSERARAVRDAESGDRASLINDARIIDEANGPNIIGDIPKAQLGTVNTIRRNIPLPLSQQRRGGLVHKLLDTVKCWGMIANLKSLFQDNRPLDPQLACLNGLRTIMIWWVILGHTFVYMSGPIGFDNLPTVQEYIKKVSFQAVSGAELAVDVFFYLSGFLVVYMVLKEMKAKKGRMSWGLFYFHRYWRLTPVYAFIILWYTNLSPYFINGPFEYQYRSLKTDQCASYWWSNMLYINNFYPTSSAKQCLGWSWYLANDMQFYIFSPIIIVVYWWRRRVGWALVSFLIAVCMILNAVLSYHYELSPLDPGNDQFNSTIYNKPYTRMAPYLIGIVFALLMQEDVDVTRTTWKRWAFYIAGSGITSCTIYLTYGYWRDGWNVFQDVMYMTFARVGFVFTIGWLMYACFKGHVGIFRQVLSLYIWIPLARLTYTVYLVHPITIFVVNFSATTTFHFSVFYGAVRYTSTLLLAYAVGILMYLMVEKPCANLEKVLLPARRKH